MAFNPNKKKQFILYFDHNLYRKLEKLLFMNRRAHPKKSMSKFISEQLESKVGLEANIRRIEKYDKEFADR